MVTVQSDIRRFGSEQEARAAAKVWSNEGDGCMVAVIESPSKEHPDQRWVADKEGDFLMAFERLVAWYKHGRLA